MRRTVIQTIVDGLWLPVKALLRPTVLRWRAWRYRRRSPDSAFDNRTIFADIYARHLGGGAPRAASSTPGTARGRRTPTCT